MEAVGAQHVRHQIELLHASLVDRLDVRIEAPGLGDRESGDVIGLGHGRLLRSQKSEARNRTAARLWLPASDFWLRRSLDAAEDDRRAPPRPSLRRPAWRG